LDKFGDLSGIVWNKRTGNLVTGHQRIESLKTQYGENLKIVEDVLLAPNQERFPIRIVDWDEKKEQAANSPKLSGEFTDELKVLLEDLQEDCLEFVELRFDELMADCVGINVEEAILKERSLQRTPKMTWVLIGIPTVEFGAISQKVESIAHIPGTVVETTINDLEIQRT